MDDRDLSCTARELWEVAEGALNTLLPKKSNESFSNISLTTEISLVIKMWDNEALHHINFIDLIKIILELK
jgi:hypothetical protein